MMRDRAFYEYNYFNDLSFEIDHSPMATQQAEFFRIIDHLNDEDYAFFLAHGEIPTPVDSADTTEAA
jgi:hypothetical protein